MKSTARDPEWLATSEENGAPRFRVGRVGDDLIAEWVGVAQLTASRDGSRHELSFERGVPAIERRKLASGSVHILLRQLGGGLGFHGAAVAVDGRAIVLLGGSGHGKSTLAAGLCARGGELLADDAVAIDLVLAPPGARVEPTEGNHWLDAEARAALRLATRRRGPKVPIRARAAGTATPVAAIVDLTWSDDERVRTTTQRGVGALARVLPHVVRFVLDSPRHQRVELEHLESLLDLVPVHVLSRPRRFALLSAGIDAALELCLKGHPSP